MEKKTNENETVRQLSKKKTSDIFFCLDKISRISSADY